MYNKASKADENLLQSNYLVILAGSKYEERSQRPRKLETYKTRTILELELAIKNIIDPIQSKLKWYRCFDKETFPIVLLQIL